MDRPTTLAQRLKSVTHIGIQHNQQLGGYTVRTYSEDEATRKATEQKHRETDSAANYEKVKAIEQHIETLMKQGRPQSELISSINELAATELAIRGIGESIYRVVGVGADYIELDKLQKTDESLILPFHKINRILIVKVGQARSVGTSK